MGYHLGTLSRRDNTKKKYIYIYKVVFLVVFVIVVSLKSLSPVTCHLSPVTCHLTTTLYRFSCYESPRKFGDAAVGSLVTDKVNYISCL